MLQHECRAGNCVLLEVKEQAHKTFAQTLHDKTSHQLQEMLMMVLLTMA